MLALLDAEEVTGSIPVPPTNRRVLNRRQAEFGIRAVLACTPVADVARSLISNEIIDVEAGQEITPPVDGALRAATFPGFAKVRR
jgi:hypothetical protein